MKTKYNHPVVPFNMLITTNSGAPRRIWTKNSAKGVKSKKAGFPIMIHYAAPARRHAETTGLSKETLCLWSGDCAKDCIADSGNFEYSVNAKAALQAKATALIMYPERYIYHMYLTALANDPDHSYIKRAEGTSDFGFWQDKWRIINGRSLYEALGDSQCAEYTKRRYPAGAQLPSNLHFTYSWSEHPRCAKWGREWLDAGYSTAVVVRAHPEEPKPRSSAKAVKQLLLDKGEWFGRKVVDGDASEARHKDPKGSIVLLYAKGSLLRATQSRFPVYVDGDTLKPTYLSKGMKL